MVNSDDINYFISAIVGSLTAFSFYKVIVSQSNIFKNRKTLKTISSTTIKSVDDGFNNGETVIVKVQIVFNLGNCR